MSIPRLPQPLLDQLVGQPVFYKKREVAAMLAVSPRTIDSWIRKGLLEAVELGGCTRISREAVEALIDRGRKKNQTDA